VESQSMLSTFVYTLVKNLSVVKKVCIFILFLALCKPLSAQTEYIFLLEKSPYSSYTSISIFQTLVATLVTDTNGVLK
jgi:hypothetical protein